MSNAKRYRDAHGRVWEVRGNHHHIAHLVHDRHGREVGFDYSAPIGRVRQRYGPVTQIPRDTDQGADRYRDREGDVWHRMASGQYSIMPGLASYYGGADLSEVRALYGPLEEVGVADKAEHADPAYRDPHGKRYRDAHGDVWTVQGNGWLTTPGVGTYQEWETLQDERGPLTPFEPERYTDCDGHTWTEDAYGEGTLRLTHAPDNPQVEGLSAPRYVVKAKYGPLVRQGGQTDDTTADQRAEALTVCVMLAKMIHGDQAHPANVAGTADTLARFILGER